MLIIVIMSLFLSGLWLVMEAMTSPERIDDLLGEDWAEVEQSME